MTVKKTTESDSLHDDLEQKSVAELILLMNQEDRKVPEAIHQVLPEIENVINRVVKALNNGGRLFYIGAGTSGRLGILDASECPPTFGVSHELVIGLIAGGDGAIRKAVEFAEDDPEQAWLDLQKHKITKNDIVIGIAASGSTPYVVSGIEECRKNGVATAAITCNADSALATAAELTIAVDVGPEFVTGSTRLKAGTAQKLILNMISTSTMIQLQRVKGNKMVDMQLSNNKLVKRGIEMLMEMGGLNREQAQALLETHGSVRAALNAVK